MSDYRVIEIIDTSTLLINYGTADNAKVGEKIRIITIGDIVQDPLTKTDLGTFDRVKATLSIIECHKHFSICQNVQTTSRNALVSPLRQFTATTKVIKELHVEEKELSNRTLPGDDIIRVGDTIEIL